jgi:apolipoprotein D and lipocalin family protein
VSIGIRMRSSTLGSIASVFLATGSVLLFRKRTRPPAVVPEVDLKKYQGEWYEIARLPARFQEDCASDVTAEYKLRSDGAVQVINSCRKANGLRKVSKGVAKLREPRGPASMLRVRFFWPFYGDYWILALDSNYRWSLVGTPNRRYLWILSRTQRLEQAVSIDLLRRASELGFDVRKIIWTHHTVDSHFSAA